MVEETFGYNDRLGTGRCDVDEIGLCEGGIDGTKSSNQISIQQTNPHLSGRVYLDSQPHDNPCHGREVFRDAVSDKTIPALM
jgi:hypothetical protein